MPYPGAALLLLLALLSACDLARPAGPVTALALPDDAPTVDAGDTLRLTLRASIASGEVVPAGRVRWSSSDPRTASVERGRVTGIRPGEVWIRAEAGSLVDSIPVRVELPIDSLELWPADTLRLIRGRTAGLRLRLLDARGAPMPHSLSISSSAPGVARVEGSEVVGAASGSAVITVRAGRKRATLPVRVVTGDRYTLTLIGNPSGTGSRAHAINDLGWVTLAADDQAGRWGAYLWRAGRRTALTPPGSGFSVPLALNDSGAVALRWSAAPSEEEGRLGLWEDGRYRTILSSELAVTTIGGLDNASRVAGTAGGRVGGGEVMTAGFVWEGSGIRWLGRGEPRRITLGGAINGRGQVLGRGTVSGRSGEFVLEGESALPIPDPTGDALWIDAVDINDRGVVVGSYAGTFAGGQGLFLWNGDRVDARGTLFGRGTSPRAINNHDEVVGCVADPDHEAEGFLLRGSEARGLNQLVPPGEWWVECAVDINDLGQILANARHRTTHDRQAVLLNPAP